jgi:glucose-1-phosphate cytidylyltransferase
MLTYGDGVANINLNELLAFHNSHGKIGTVTGVRPPSRFGELLVEKNRAVLFSEKPQTSSSLINGGFFVFNRKIFNYLTEDDNCDFEKGPLEELAKDGELMVYENKGDWACMDTVRDMEYLNKLWRSGQAFWKIWE